MATFLLAGGLLLVALLAIVLPPLWHGARRSAVVLALALAVGSAGLYVLVGTPDALQPAYRDAPKTLDEAIVQLERRLAAEPGSVEGWVLLGRSRVAQGRYDLAAEAFAKAQALLPDDPDLMVETADVQMRAAPQGRFPDSATALLERALQINPNHQRALFWLGAQRLQSGQPAQAVELWERLLPMVEPATAEALRPQLAMAREQAGLAPRDDGDAPAGGTNTTGPTLTITVELAPAVADRLAPGDTLFVFARTPDGAGLPVAVKRLPAGGFPLSVTLSDADGLMPAQKLSQQASVRLMARVSKSGDAAGAAGDLEATPQVIDVRDGATMRLVIDQVRP